MYNSKELYMSKTNSNSITSILIYELNRLDSDFREKMLNQFKIPETSSDIRGQLLFYDGTHSSLKLKTMKRKEVDIYARVPGEYKLRLMIEVKAGINETLQESQKKNKEYDTTAKTEGASLFYIIPKYYSHRSKLDFCKDTIIEWEDILQIAEDCSASTNIADQIRNFVEITEKEAENSSELMEVFKNITDLIKSRSEVKNKLGEILTFKKEFSESANEFGFYWKKKTRFLGYNYKDCNNKDYVFSLDIMETEDNTELGKNGVFYIDGWYYIPIEKESSLEIKAGTQNILESFTSDIDKEYLMKNLDFFYDNQEKIKKLPQLKICLNKLYENFLNKNTQYKKDQYQDDEYGIGYYFLDKAKAKKEFFIGLSPEVNNENYIFSVVRVHKSEKQKYKKKDVYFEINHGGKNYEYIAIDTEKLKKCTTWEDLQKEFNKQVEELLKNWD